MTLPLGEFWNSGFNLSDRAGRILAMARCCAATSGNSEVSPTHLLNSLAMGERGTARMILEAGGVYLDRDQKLLLAEPTESDYVEARKIGFDDECVSLFQCGKEFGALLGLGSYFGTEHILFGLVNSPQLPVYQHLSQHGVSADSVKTLAVSVLRLENV